MVRKPVKDDVIRTIQAESRVVVKPREWKDFNPALLYYIGDEYKVKCLRGLIIQLQGRVKLDSNKYNAKLLTRSKLAKVRGWKIGDIIKIWKSDIVDGRLEKYK